MLSTHILIQCHQLWFDLIVKMLKVFHENIQCYILYIYININISYQDVTYGLFFYLSDFDFFVKIISKLSMLLNKNNKSTFAVVFAVCVE